MLKAEIVQVQRSFALPFRLSAFLFLPALAPAPFSISVFSISAFSSAPLR
jgi:hypothetical protein